MHNLPTIVIQARMSSSRLPGKMLKHINGKPVLTYVIERLQHCKNNKGLIDGLVSLPPTAPLRSVADIDKCLDEFEKGGVDVVITVTDAHRSPYYNMVVNDNNYSSLVIKPDSMVARRQDVPIVFDMTTVAYVARPSFVYEKEGIFEGRVKSVHIPLERSVDIDTLHDFKIAECLFKNNVNNENN